MIRLTLLPLLALVLGADWPTFQGDYRRSGVSSERVAAPLAEAWRYRARHAPAPAWPEPAREDVSNRYRKLRAVVAYDRAHQVVVAGGGPSEWGYLAVTGPLLLGSEHAP